MYTKNELFFQTLSQLSDSQFNILFNTVQTRVHVAKEGKTRRIFRTSRHNLISDESSNAFEKIPCFCCYGKLTNANSLFQVFLPGSVNLSAKTKFNYRFARRIQALAFRSSASQAKVCKYAKTNQIIGFRTRLPSCVYSLIFARRLTSGRGGLLGAY